MGAGFTRSLAVLFVALLVTLGGCRIRTPTVPAGVVRAGQRPIMAAARLDAVRIANWFNIRQPPPNGTYAATVPVEALARIFLEEGASEGVAGDLAFMQAIVETAWFRFSGAVPASSNNFAGIGATGTGARAAVFRDARTGVRAQIQHLRAYADPRADACSVPPLANPCVDPRFDLVSPKGKAPAWNLMGNGNWATSASYGAAILALYDEALAFSGLSQ